MMMLMYMLVAMYQLFVPVRMLMHQIRPHQKIGAEEKIIRLAIGYDVVFLTHNDNAGCNFIHDIQVLRAEDDAFVFFHPLQ